MHFRRDQFMFPKREPLVNRQGWSVKTKMRLIGHAKPKFFCGKKMINEKEKESVQPELPLEDEPKRKEDRFEKAGVVMTDSSHRGGSMRLESRVLSRAILISKTDKDLEKKIGKFLKESTKAKGVAG